MPLNCFNFRLKALELPKMSNKLRGLGRFRIKKRFLETITHKIYEPNCSFHVK